MPCDVRAEATGTQERGNDQRFRFHEFESQPDGPGLNVFGEIMPVPPENVGPLPKQPACNSLAKKRHFLENSGIGIFCSPLLHCGETGLRRERTSAKFSREIRVCGRFSSGRLSRTVSRTGPGFSSLVLPACCQPARLENCRRTESDHTTSWWLRPFRGPADRLHCHRLVRPESQPATPGNQSPRQPSAERRGRIPAWCPPVPDLGRHIDGS